MVRYISDEVTVITATPTEAPTKLRKDERRAHLIVLSGTNVGQVFELPKDRISLGRDDKADIQIMDAGISRRHAVIERYRDGAYHLQDDGSRNGTFANNHRVDEFYNLADGDKIQIGVMTILKFAYTDEAEANYAQKMYEKAHRDGLIGIFNRRYFEDRLNADFGYAKRHNQHLALLMLDLDHFKAVNDTHGHPAGDVVLKAFAQLVTKNIRSDDILARYGGEEFVVLCRQTDLMKASILGERIRHAVSQYIFVAGEKQLRVTTSIGIAGLPDPEITEPKGMVEAADESLYKAKQRGRNCVVARRPR
jgi:diguanylate cyclase (GGDEF)-like protein